MTAPLPGHQPAPQPSRPPGRPPEAGPVPAPGGYDVPPSPGGLPPPGGYGRPAVPSTGPDGRPLAEFGDRFLAYLIDYAILFAVNLVVVVPVVIIQFWIMGSRLVELERAQPIGSTPDPAEVFGDLIWPILVPLLGLYAAMLVATLLIYYLYRVELMYRTGQTVGKRVMKLKVVPLHPGAPLTRATAAKRWLVDSAGASLVPFLVYLDGLWQLWDQPYRQCLHDKLARTVVVKVGP